MQRMRVLGVATVATLVCGSMTVSAQKSDSRPAPETLPVGSGHEKSQSQTVTLSFTNVTIREAIYAIANDAGLAVVFDDRDTTLKTVLGKSLTVKFNNSSVQAALTRLMRGTGYTATVAARGRGIIIAKAEARKAAAADSTGTGTVLGTVLDSATGRGLPGAVITLQGTKLAASTNDDGQFTLRGVSQGEHIVMARSFGYTQASRGIALGEGARATLNFVLARTPTVLSGVVTTATGHQQRLEIGNAITSLNVPEILAKAPITSVTDLLETRVPGLIIQRTSGTPGDPARLRLRGAGSISRSNDPIVVVDGIRLFSDANGDQNSNLAVANVSSQRPGGYAAPSALDQIDPNSIETIDVFKGPSAAALYGSDAANGVIVITTKRGVPGKARWSAVASSGQSKLGSYPTGYFRFGTYLNGGPSQGCPPWSFSCTLDSLVYFQALNDPRYTVLGTGTNNSGSVSVSGGVQTLRYSFTGSGSRQLGILKLPNTEVERYTLTQGFAPPDWMRRPDNYKTWSVDGSLFADIGSAFTASVTSSLFNSAQQRSSLESEIFFLLSAYIDPTTAATSGILNQFYERVTANQLTSNSSAQITWSPWSWMPISATAGINVANARDEAVVPRNVLPVSDTNARYGVGIGNTLTRTINVGTVAQASRWVNVAGGINVVGASSNTNGASTTTLPPGVTKPTVFPSSTSTFSQTAVSQTTYGWYVEPRLNVNSRFFVMPGFRIDGGSNSGSNAKLNGFPKINTSWVASEERFFPLKQYITLFRLRGAFGYAGVQPSATSQYRFFQPGLGQLSGGDSSILTISTFGNTHLRPERAREFEGGVDAELLDGRVSAELTTYRKVRVDAIIDVPVPGSVYGGGTMSKNIGTVRNTGTEATVNARVIQTNLVAWDLGVAFSQNSNVVVNLNPGGTPITLGDGLRVVPGYPIFGQWALPIAGYFDANHNRVIESNEVVIGDTMVYMGPTTPRYTATINTTLSLFRGRVNVAAVFDDQVGLTQRNTNSSFLFQAINDPNSSPGEQAALASFGKTSYGLFQTLSTVRFNSMSVTYSVPESVARRFRSRLMTVGIQGSNLHLWTNYRGKDPNVNAFNSGNSIADTGQLPQPRTWNLRVSLGN